MVAEAPEAANPEILAPIVVKILFCKKKIVAESGKKLQKNYI